MAQFEQETSYDSSEPNSITNSSTQEGEHTIHGDEEEEEGIADALLEEEAVVVVGKVEQPEKREAVPVVLAEDDDDEEEEEDERTLATTPTNEMNVAAPPVEVVESLPRDDDGSDAAAKVKETSDEVEQLRKKLEEVRNTILASSRKQHPLEQNCYQIRTSIYR